MADERLYPDYRVYTPAEMVGVYRTFLRGAMKNEPVWVRGIYLPLPNPNPSYATVFDELRDTDTNSVITVKLTPQQRGRLRQNALVHVAGVPEVMLYSNGTMKVALAVSRVEVVRDKLIDEQSERREAIRQTKATHGYKNVQADIEQRIFQGERPQVALLFAQQSITGQDFDSQVEAARLAIDFHERRTPFSDAQQLAATLRDLDSRHFAAVALIRGGGSGLDALDAPEVLEAVARMQTPTIAAVGHAADQLFVKTLADKTVATPTDLGHYFAAIVEHITEVRTHSRAVLVEEVRKQYTQQLAEADKKNAALLQRVDTLTRSQQDTARGFATQSQALQQRLDQAQRRAHELETQMAGSRTPTLLYVVIALVAAIVGFVLHIVVA